MKFKIIHTALSPNVYWSDIFLSLRLMLPWELPKLRFGPHIKQLEEQMKNRLRSNYTVAVGSGREALQMAIASLPIPPKSAILVQSFTCMVVINAIRWAGHYPVYVDIDDLYNMDPLDLEKKYNSKCAAVIIQHTFGIPAQTSLISEFCKKKKIYLIEDCAHSLGTITDFGEAGTAGDISIFSFGRSKIISSVNGGLVSTNSFSLAENLRILTKSIHNTSRFRTIQNLLHIPITSIAKTFYWSPLGKIVMIISQKLKLINLEVTPEEKHAIRPHFFISKLPNAMARLALSQLAKLNDFNTARRKAAQYYYDNLSISSAPNPSTHKGAIFLRYPIQIKNPQGLLNVAKKNSVILGDWYSSPVAPCDVDTKKTYYQSGSCPRCEQANSQMINLPTHPNLTDSDLDRIVKIINNYVENKADK